MCLEVRNIKFLNEQQREEIGFTYLLDKLEPITPFGLEEKKNLKPFTSEDSLQLTNELTMLQTVVESLNLYKTYYDELQYQLYFLKDIRGSIKRCANSEILDEIELFELKTFLLKLDNISHIIKQIDLSIPYAQLNPISEALNILDPEGKRMPTFYIYDVYSEKLSLIRNQKRLLEHKIMLTKEESAVKALMEERAKIVIIEEYEDLEVRQTLSHNLKQYMVLLSDSISKIGKIDLLIAKAKLSIRYEGIKPEISKAQPMVLKELTNPMLSDLLKESGSVFTPINIELTPGTAILTGANMGGKSVAMKTIVLNLLLAQYGFFVYARTAIIPQFDFLYLISGDMQSSTGGLSTFGAEIISLKESLSYAKKEKGFIAIDEFARGTNPQEGAILVKALVHYLSGFESISLISTHFDGIVEENTVHYQIIGLKNVNFTYLKQQISIQPEASTAIIQRYMDYRLERVQNHCKVPKDALNISTLLGLDNELINLIMEYYRKIGE